MISTCVPHFSNSFMVLSVTEAVCLSLEICYISLCSWNVAMCVVKRNDSKKREKAENGPKFVIEADWHSSSLASPYSDGD